jgi:hypothetical protein
VFFTHQHRTDLSAIAGAAQGHIFGNFHKVGVPGWARHSLIVEKMGGYVKWYWQEDGYQP